MGVDNEQVYAMSLHSSLWAPKHQCNGINLVINNRVKTKLNIAQTYFMYCLVPTRLSLDENFACKGGLEGENRQNFASQFSPFHGPLCFITNHLCATRALRLPLCEKQGA